MLAFFRTEIVSKMILEGISQKKRILESQINPVRYLNGSFVQFFLSDIQIVTEKKMKQKKNTFSSSDVTAFRVELTYYNLIWWKFILVFYKKNKHCILSDDDLELVLEFEFDDQTRCNCNDDDDDWKWSIQSIHQWWMMILWLT